MKDRRIEDSENIKIKMQTKVERKNSSRVVAQMIECGQRSKSPAQTPRLPSQITTTKNT